MPRAAGRGGATRNSHWQHATRLAPPQDLNSNHTTAFGLLHHIRPRRKKLDVMSGAREQSLPSKRKENQEEQSETGSQRKASRESSEPAQSDEDERPDQNPRSKLENFDWDDLESRYQSMVQFRDLEEHKLWEEFTQLVEVNLPWSFFAKRI